MCSAVERMNYTNHKHVGAHINVYINFTNHIRTWPYLVLNVQQAAGQISKGDEIVADALSGVARHGFAQRTVDHTRCPAVGIRKRRQVPTRGVAQRVVAVLHASVVGHALVI